MAAHRCPNRLAADEFISREGREVTNKDAKAHPLPVAARGLDRRLTSALTQFKTKINRRDAEFAKCIR